MRAAVWPKRLAALAAGVVIGLALGAALGWVVWPVRYYNTDLVDLKADHQDAYILMVSEQWERTRDLNQARAALALLTALDLSPRMEQAAQRLEAGGNLTAARRVRKLAEALKQP